MSNVRRTSLQKRIEEGNARVEDYLNDRLQTYADLENLDSLLESVRNQQSLLRQQLQEAEATLVNTNLASRVHSTLQTDHVEKFRTQQTNIDRRLLIVTRSDTSDDAILKFDASMEKLRRLDVAKGYVELLAEVDKLSADARRNFQSPQAALRPYLQLQKLANALKRAQPAAEDAAPHLVDHVDRTAQYIWKQMKDTFAADFNKTLKKIKWPSKDITLESALRQEWSAGVERLLKLQEPEFKAREDYDQVDRQLEPLILLPLEVIVKPLEMRFGYHFEGDRPTNRLDKPEYFLEHVISLLSTYEQFFLKYLQPILRQHFKGSSLDLNLVYVDSTSALITALLPMLRRKVSLLLPQVAKQPQLLSHLMHELMSFDSNLRDEWAYDGGCGADGWKGLTWEVLVKKDWFGKWLQIEKDFALSRYMTIMEAPENGEIDYDSVDPGVTKPTKAAIRVNDLLETVTDRYRPLVSFSQKLRFLIDIQISIFDRYHDRLHSALEAYLTMTSSIARTVQGISREEHVQLQGIAGLERLLRVYASAEYLEKKMRDWSDDVFFLELWDELQYRARKHDNPQEALAGSMSLEDVAGRTSKVVGSDEDNGALFDETSMAYHRLRVRTEGIIQENLFNNIRETLRPYGRINPWSSLSSESASIVSAALSAELDATVERLSSQLALLAKVLADVPLRRITRQLALSMQTWFWDYIIARNSFSTPGVIQLERDLETIWETFDRYVGAGQGKLGMRKLAEAVDFMSLSMKTQQHNEDADTRGSLSLWEAEKRIFQSNESAREVLEDLGLQVLTESDARQLLEKRIELGS